jgi:hypothetical protein
LILLVLSSATELLLDLLDAFLLNLLRFPKFLKCYTFREKLIEVKVVFAEKLQATRLKKSELFISNIVLI